MLIITLTHIGYPLIAKGLSHLATLQADGARSEAYISARTQFLKVLVSASEKDLEVLESTTKAGEKTDCSAVLEIPRPRNDH
jgi:hypothetical protein